MTAYFVHPTAVVETDQIGAGTHIWAFAHVLAGAVIGSNSNIGDNCFIEGGAIVGDGVTLKNGTAIWNGVTLGDGSFIGSGVIFMNDRSPRSRRMAEVRDRYRDERAWLVPTLVGRGSTIGAGAIIVAGVEIGKYAFVGAGTLVNRNVQPHAYVMGQPARLRAWVCMCGEILGSRPARGAVLRCSRCESSLKWDGTNMVADAERPRLTLASPDG